MDELEFVGKEFKCIPSAIVFPGCTGFALGHEGMRESEVYWLNVGTRAGLLGFESQLGPISGVILVKRLISLCLCFLSCKM